MVTPIRSGNYDRGWNDPPVFSYTDQTAANAAVSQRGGYSILHRSPRAKQDHETNNAGADLDATAPPSTLGLAAEDVEGCEIITTKSHVVETPSLPHVLDNVYEILDECQLQGMKKQVRSDIEKKLKLFEDQWTTDKLAIEVQRRMVLLINALNSTDYVEADNQQRTLIVDFSSQVCNWMVGFKKLIMLSKQLRPSPEVDTHLANSAEVGVVVGTTYLVPMRDTHTIPVTESVTLPGTVTVPPAESLVSAEVAVVGSDNPTELSVSESAAPTDLPMSESAAPTDLPMSELAEPTDLPMSESAVPADLPMSESAAQTDLPMSESAAQTDLPMLESAAPTDLPMSESAAPTDLPISESAGPTDLSMSESAEPTDLPMSESAAPTDLPMSESAAQTDLPMSESAASMDLPVTEPAENHTLTLKSNLATFGDVCVPQTDSACPTKIPTFDSVASTSMPTTESADIGAMPPSESAEIGHIHVPESVNSTANCSSTSAESVDATNVVLCKSLDPALNLKCLTIASTEVTCAPASAASTANMPIPDPTSSDGDTRSSNLVNVSNTETRDAKTLPVPGESAISADVAACDNSGESC